MEHGWSRSVSPIGIGSGYSVQSKYESNVMLNTVTAYGPSAGSTRVRVFDWLDHFGLKANVTTYLGKSNNSISIMLRSPRSVVRTEHRLRNLAQGIDKSTVLLSRQASPFSNGHLESRLLSRAGRGVYDFDDALMHSAKRLRERVWSRRRIWQASVRAADVVIAGNEYLAQYASDLNNNVVIIPSCVDPRSYSQKKDYGLSDTPRAVWVGSPSGEDYLTQIAEALLALHDSHGLRLSVVSAGSRSLGPLDDMIDRYSWTTSAAMKEMLRADFGIMPVDNSPWSRGKCAYKLLQYCATGLPIIGSPVGANVPVLKRADGLSPSNSEEWREAMSELLAETTSRRRQRGAAGRKAVETQYSFEVWSGAWAGALGLQSDDRNDSERA